MPQRGSLRGRRQPHAEGPAPASPRPSVPAVSLLLVSREELKSCLLYALDTKSSGLNLHAGQDRRG